MTVVRYRIKHTAYKNHTKFVDVHTIIPRKLSVCLRLAIRIEAKIIF